MGHKFKPVEFLVVGAAVAATNIVAQRMGMDGLLAVVPSAYVALGLSNAGVTWLEPVAEEKEGEEEQWTEPD